MEVVEPITTVSQSKNNDPQLLEAYIGKGAGKYIAAQNHFDSTNKKTYWNWSSAVLGPIWLFHRKMYGLFALCLLLLVPILAIFGIYPLILIYAHNLGLIRLIYFLSSLLFMGIILGLGFYGSNVYLNKVRKAIFKYKYITRDNDELIKILNKEGNPSILNSIVGIFLTFIGIIFSFGIAVIIISAFRVMYR